MAQPPVTLEKKTPIVVFDPRSARCLEAKTRDVASFVYPPRVSSRSMYMPRHATDGAITQELRVEHTQ